tara:strand:- start:2946 stop:3173 length:228 start_codon:yes stop_codon:yes gene_type:complete
MPIWLRKFTYQQIYEAKQAEADSYKNSGNKGKGTNIDLNNPSKANIPKSPFNPPTNKGSNKKQSQPNYITKASKK